MNRNSELYRSIVILTVLTAGMFCFIGACSVMSAKVEPVEPNPYLSPESLAVDNGRGILYIAESTAGKIAVFDADKGAVIREIALGSNPNGLVLSGDGGILFAACGGAEGTVEIIDTATGGIVASVPVGHTPCSPVLNPEGSMLYVCNRFDDNVSIVDTAEMFERNTIPMLREPVAADMTPDGRYLFVANHLPSGKLIREYVTDGGVYMIGTYHSTGYFNQSREAYVFSAVVLVYDTRYNRLVELIRLPNGSTGVRGLCISPDGNHCYVTHILARYHLPTTQPERGWINTNALSIIDARDLKLVNTVLLDDLDRGAANPRGVTCTGDGGHICVAHAGTHEISIIDREALHERLDLVARGADTPTASKSVTDVPNDLSFLYGLRHRVELPGNGPRGLAVLGTRVFAAEYFSDSVSMVEVDADEAFPVKQVPLGPSPIPTPERQGEMYFNDARLCFQSWQSCASCHPDGRADGLNWDLLNDGIGNPKNTKSLLLSHLTPPVMVTGIRKDAETAVRSGLRHIHFTEKTDDIAVAIDSYLKDMKPVPSPYLTKGKLSREARRGRKVFRKAGCFECHPPPYFTNLLKSDVGTGTGRSIDTDFDTPTLVEIWRTAPYLYNGRSDSMEGVLMKFNEDDLHGLTSSLKRKEISDLLLYILSL